jgi:hypothetical protein
MKLAKSVAHRGFNASVALVTASAARTAHRTRQAGVRSPGTDGRRVMKRALLTVVASALALLVLVSTVPRASGRVRTAVVKTHVAIQERLSAQPNSDQTHSGKFSLRVNGLLKDAGTSSVSPNVGAAEIVGGQVQYPVTGYDELTTKKGTLNISFVGISILVNGKFYNEFGSWKIRTGSGIYKGWKGGGRWADVGTPIADNIELDGLATHP